MVTLAIGQSTAEHPDPKPRVGSPTDPSACRTAVHRHAGDGARLVIEDCSVSGNKLNGVLVRDGAAPLLLRNSIVGNGAFGVVLQVRAPWGRIPES